MAERMRRPKKVKRFYDYSMGIPNVTKPNIYALHVGGFNEVDEKNFKRLV